MLQKTQNRKHSLLSKRTRDLDPECALPKGVRLRSQTNIYSPAKGFTEVLACSSNPSEVSS